MIWVAVSPELVTSLQRGFGNFPWKENFSKLSPFAREAKYVR